MSVSWSIERYGTVSSTQDIVKDKAAAGAPEGVVAVADMQTGGRGRHGRVWVSQAGNLFFSFLLRPGCTAAEAGQLALLAGLAAGEAIRKISGRDVILKWPNDVLVEGKKCAGLLVDTALAGARVEWMVVGCGVNAAAAPDEHAAHLGGVDRDILLEDILAQAGHYYALWRAEGFAPVCAAWLALGPEKGCPVQVKTGTRVIQGLFEGVDGQGALLLQSSGEIKKVTAGDVYI